MVLWSAEKSVGTKRKKGLLARLRRMVAGGGRIAVGREWWAGSRWWV